MPAKPGLKLLLITVTVRAFLIRIDYVRLASDYRNKIRNIKEPGYGGQARFPRPRTSTNV